MNAPSTDRNASKAWTFEEKAASFWAKVDRSGGHTACWIWNGAITAKWGYGCFAISAGQVRGAHKLAWLLTNGDNKGLCVLHHCDNRVCVNPAHLYLGTKIDNARDKVVRGRDSTATLKEYQVREIKKALTTPYHGIQRDLANHYNVKSGVISDIKQG